MPCSSIIGGMEMRHFHKLRLAVQTNAPAGSGADLETVEHRLRDQLAASGVFSDVEVASTDDPDKLVIGLCRFSAQYSEQAVADLIEETWQGRLRYPFWEAHAVYVDKDHVEFEAATRSGQHGHYVTVHMIAQKAQIPAQRTPSD